MTGAEANVAVAEEVAMVEVVEVDVCKIEDAVEDSLEPEMLESLESAG